MGLTVMVQVYMPTTDDKDDEVDAVYERIEELLNKKTKGKYYTFVVRLRDWNAVVRDGKEDTFVGHYRLAYRNYIHHISSLLSSSSFYSPFANTVMHI